MLMKYDFYLIKMLLDQSHALKFSCSGKRTLLIFSLSNSNILKVFLSCMFCIVNIIKDNRQDGKKRSETMCCGYEPQDIRN